MARKKLIQREVYPKWGVKKIPPPPILKRQILSAHQWTISFVELHICYSFATQWDAFSVNKTCSGWFCFSMQISWKKFVTAFNDLSPVHTSCECQCECEVNLTSQPSFRSNIRKWVERSSTAANFSLRICDVNIRIAFALAGSMNRALHVKVSCFDYVDTVSHLKFPLYSYIVAAQKLAFATQWIAFIHSFSKIYFNAVIHVNLQNNNTIMTHLCWKIQKQ